ncbi:MAG: SGNH/GDSL hydrolase family protein [Thermodesulfobacteriota bacterium]
MDFQKTPHQEKHRLANLGKNLFLILISLVVALGVVEVALRFYNPLGFRIKGDTIVLPVNRTDVVHHRHSAKLDQVIKVHRNSLGFMGEAPPPDFAQWLTILAIGGSTTECLELSDDKTWPLALGANLKKSFGKLWINNAGLAGHSTVGHLILMQDYVLKIKPKVVLFLIGINDIGLIRTAEFETRMIKKISFRSLEGFLTGMANYSEVFAAILNLKRFYFPRVTIRIVHEEIDLKTVATADVPPAARAAKIQLYREKYLGAFKQRLNKLVQIAQSHDIIPVLITQPVLFGNLQDPATGVNLAKVEIGEDMDGELAWKVLELYNDTTRNVGQEDGVLVIDLARKMPKTSIYYYDFMHFTNGGAEKAAEIVSQELQPYLARKFPGYVLSGGSRGDKN